MDNQTPIQMELNTGTSLSQIKKHTYDDIADHSHILMRATDVHLETYTGEALEILGEVGVSVNCGEEQQQLLVYVVDGNGPNLMGRDWLCSLKVSVGVSNSMTASNKTEIQISLQSHCKNMMLFYRGVRYIHRGKDNFTYRPPSKAKVFQTMYLTFLS